MPLPEAVDLGEWEIVALPGIDGASVWLSRDGQGGVLRVPLGGDEADRYVRAHELGHIAWSPREPVAPHVPQEVFEYAEDARIAHRLVGVGIPARVRLLSDAEIAERAATFAAGEASRLQAACLLLAMLEVPDGRELGKALAKIDPELPEIVERVWVDTIGCDSRPGVERAVAAAELLMRMFPSDAGRASRGRGCILRSLGRLLGPLHGSRDGDNAHPDSGGGTLDAPDPHDHPGWGRLTIVEVPRPLRLAPRTVGVGWRAAEEGQRLGDPSRFYRDGRGFRARRPRRHLGGSVLIDCSGSMRLSAETLEELVAANPAALIATYSGDDQEDLGRLHIVAKGGRRAHSQHLRPPGRRNLVDLPALEFLASQPPPRFWVSDGGVTGCGERRTERLVAEVEAFVRRCGVRRIATAECLLGEWGEARARPR